jgi:hypothetical protein
MPEYGMEKSSFASQEEVQNMSNCRKAYVFRFLGLNKGYYWNIIKRGVTH